MIRLILLWIGIFACSIYTLKDWYVSLCGLIVLMAFLEHPDIPRSMFGISGLNPWNILFFVVLVAWAANRRREGLRWDMPRYLTVLLVLFLVLILVSSFRALADRSYLYTFDEYSTLNGLIRELLVNTIKWSVPGLLLFHGCRSRSRFFLGLSAVLALYFLLGLQVIKWMPLSSIHGGDSLQRRAVKILDNEIGYQRIDLSMMLAGASWAFFAARVIMKRSGPKLTMMVGSFLMLFAQALTGGRMGYVTWGVIGLVLCLLRWPRYLLFAPLVAAAILIALPSVRERMLQGFGGSETDEYTITAGRNLLWPYVIAKIREGPIFGFGRLGIIRTGVDQRVRNETEEVFGQPHNAYLEMLIDNGLVGLGLVLLFYLVVLRHSFSLLRDSGSPIFVCIGGVTSSFVLALLVASMGAQTLYPREGVVGMWCAIGLMLRVMVERAQGVKQFRALSSVKDVVEGLSVKPVRVATFPRPTIVASKEKKGTQVPLSLDNLLWTKRMEAKKRWSVV